MKIALVHDWLTGMRGGERVLDHLARRFPDADLHTLVHVPGRTSDAIEARRIATSPLASIPGVDRHYRKLLPLFPWAIRRFDFAGFDLVLSTSHAVAKSIRTPPGVAHVAYCFTPMRYIWDQADAYLGRGLRRAAAAPLLAALRRFDVQTSDEEHVTRFIAISHEIAGRIRRHYGREARVVPPPVDVSWIEPASAPADDSYLLVGGFVPYKRDALAIEAFRGLGRRLVVVGDGPARAALERAAPPNVEFTGRVTDSELAELYRRSRALIYPQHEDFGLVAVEAQAAGRPVIAYGAGGVLDTVRPLSSSAAPGAPVDSLHREVDLSFESGPTGVFFERQDVGALTDAIERFEKAETQFHPPRLRHWAERFSPSRFDAALDEEIRLALEQTP